MGIVIRVNGSSAGDGFLIAPDNGRTFSVPLNLSTDDGTTVNATADATPNGAGMALPGGAISVGPAGTDIPINATAVSNNRGDTKINVHVGGATTTFVLTAISNPVIWFRGRFEARFATDGDYYNNPRGTDGGTPGHDPNNDGVGPNPGWTWALEGEPDFVPSGVDSHGAPNSVPTTVDKPAGRVVRLNNPVALRPFAAPVGTTVNEISGSTMTGTEVFTAGDPVFGATANLGPNTYLSANQPVNPSDPLPYHQYVEGNEPMNLFEFHIDGFFTGKSATLADRPTAAGYVPLDAAEQAVVQFIDPVTSTAQAFFPLTTFNSERLKQLQHAFSLLSPADQTGTVAGRNLTTRMNHFAANPTEAQAWSFKEEYSGQVNDSITIQLNASSILAYFAGYTAFAFVGKFFTFHSDELDGYVHGSLTVNPAAALVKTCSLQLQNSTFGKDELISMGLPTTFPSAFWVVMDGFFPSELGIDASDNLTNPPNPPTVTFSIDPPANANPAIVNALQTQHQLQIQPFTGAVLTTALPPPSTPQRILYPFTIQFTGTDGFVNQTEFLTLTATITVDGKQYNASAPLELTTAANPYVIDADAGNQYTSWLSTDLRVFKVDDDELFFGKRVSDFYPPGAVAAQYPVTAAAASTAATAYIADLIQRLTPSGSAGLDSFESSLTEVEAASRDQLEYLQVDPRTGKAAFNFAVCRVRIHGTTPPNTPPPFTTQARNCRVFFRAFQAQSTVSTFSPTTTYRSTPIGTPDVSARVPLLGVETDAMSQEEIVTIPFFAVDRVNLAGPADLTTQQPDAPNVQTISPITGMEVDTYYGCWLDMNQPTPLFPQFVKPGDFDNQTGYFNTGTFTIQSINAAFSRAPHQCLIAEIAFDDIPIPPNADASTSDKLAQRNLAYIDGPNPGDINSRRMPHPFQLQASNSAATHVDELMISWGNTPADSTGSIYLPGVAASEIIALADSLYPYHGLTMQDVHTITVPSGPVSFVPIPRNTGFLAGLLTVTLPPGVRRGDVYKIVVRQITEAVKFLRGYESLNQAEVGQAGAHPKKKAQAKRLPPSTLVWRRVLGAFQIDIPISTKQELLLPEEHQLALFRWIAGNVQPQSRWHPVMQRYIEQLAGRVTGFGGDPGKIPPSPTGNVPVQPCHDGEERHEHHEVTGKVNGIVFDHFGDFEGFVLETWRGELWRFQSRERRVLEIVRAAFEDRSVVTVIRHSERKGDVQSIIVRLSPAWPDC